MYFLRPVQPDDLDTIYQFTQDVGFGFSLVPNKKHVEEKLHASVISWQQKVEKPTHEFFYFVCESVEGEIVGMSGLISRIGIDQPFYAYHIINEKHQSKQLNLDREISTLHFLKAKKKPTEVCSLFLKKAHRQCDCSKLLSLGRFLFIASFPRRFAPITVGEIRGVNNEKGESPFWEAVGRKFFELPFQEAHIARILTPECIEEIFPQYPIYPILLSKDANEVIGIPHPQALPAAKILEKQGFIKSHYIDLFEGGPHYYASTHEIDAVANSQLGRVSHLVKQMEGKTKGIATNTTMDFRAVWTSYIVDKVGRVSIDEQTASTLKLKPGDLIRTYEVVS
ncbi:MAG: arginine N-succinyltransferase [Chlamydiia bacterium]|nr:arginine N-succinyltransferase [Chlamydiia bacterium]